MQLDSPKIISVNKDGLVPSAGPKLFYMDIRLWAHS